jgi:hypothetical protein
MNWILYRKICRRLKGNTAEIVEPKLKVNEERRKKTEEKKPHLYEVSYWAK